MPGTAAAPITAAMAGVMLDPSQRRLGRRSHHSPLRQRHHQHQPGSRSHHRASYSKLPPSSFFFSSVTFNPNPFNSLHSTSNATGMPASSLLLPLTMLS